jgi:hypothetical protein
MNNPSSALIATLCLAFTISAFAQDITLDVTTDRVAYAPAQEVSISITTKNEGKAPQSGRLVSTIHCDIDTRYEILNEQITLQPGQRFQKTIGWQSPDDELWGCEVTARLMVDENAIASDRQVFVVSDHLIKTAANLQSISPGYFKSGVADPIAYAYEKFHDFGIPVLHVACWAPSNWGKIYPDTDSWVCAQMRYRVSFDDVDLMVRHAKQRGMFTVTYGRITLEGIEGYRWAKANPDKIWYRNPDGKLKAFPDDALKEWERAESDPKIHQGLLRKLKRWTMIPKLNDNGVLDDGIDQYIRAIKRFGFDCIRWDWHPGYFYQPHQNWLLQIGSAGAVHTKYFDRKGKLDLADDPDAEHVRIIQRWKRRMKEALPNLSFGFNLQVANSVYPDNDEINPQPTRAYSEMVRDSLIIDEKHFVSFSKARPAGMHRNWKRTLNFWHKGSELVRRYGGYHYTGGHPNVGAAPFIQHAYSLSYACGARGTNVASPNVKHEPWHKDLVAFSQRFAMYFFHSSMHNLAYRDSQHEFGGRFSVESSRPVIWKPFARTITDRGHFTMLVHLWNQPVEDKMNKMVCDAPPQVESSVVKFTQPLDLPHAQAKAFAISYEWPEWVREIKIDSSKPTVEIKVPSFQYWSTVMLQYPLSERPASR